MFFNFFIEKIWHFDKIWKLSNDMDIITYFIYSIFLIRLEDENPSRDEISYHLETLHSRNQDCRTGHKSSH